MPHNLGEIIKYREDLLRAHRIIACAAEDQLIAELIEFVRNPKKTRTCSYYKRCHEPRNSNKKTKAR